MNSPFLSRFTPSLMTREALEVLFVQREELAQRIVELIRDSVLTRSKHHTLLIGPRGIGKTHLVSVIYHRIEAMKDLRDRLLIAWLREEELGVTSFLDLLLRMLRALHEKYGESFPGERFQALYDMSSDVAEHQAALLLKDFAANRTLFLIVENLDALFEELGDEGQKRLRAYLQENEFCTILATAQSLFNGVSLQTSPFYGLFRIHHLEELKFEGAVLLLGKIATFVDDKELASLVQTSLGRARVRAVHHLAGGNHRVYVIFSEFLTRESLNELVGPVMRTLDDLTPYYQARMSWLSPQQRKIVEFLCDRRGAVPVKEIAQRCFMTHQTAASQLKDLKEKGYVWSEPIGRESYYELREPLMRLCIEMKKNRGEPIRLLVDFLRLWYSRKGLQHRLETLKPEAGVEREYLLHAVKAYEKKPEDLLVAVCLKDCEAYLKKGDYANALQVAEELVAIREQATDWANQGHYLGHLKRWPEALASCEKAVELDKNCAPAWFYRGWALAALERLEEALACFNRVLELQPNDTTAWENKGITLRRLDRYEEALASFDRVIELDPKDTRAWLHRGLALERLGRYEEASLSFKKLIEFNPKDSHAWLHQSFVLCDLGRYEDALSAADRVLELNPKSKGAWLHRGETLQRLGRYEDALSAANKVIELQPTNAEAWHLKGITLGNLGRYEEALASCDKSIELGEQSPHVFFNRAEALLALNRWEEGTAVLEDALRRFDQAKEPSSGDIKTIVRNALITTPDTASLRVRIKTLVELYHKYGATAILGQALVGSIVTLTSPMVSDKAAQAWFEVWRELVSNRTEFELPLRLVDAAVRYRETQDPRILLGLPSEERNLLKPLLGVEDPEEHKSNVSSSQPIPEQKELKPRRQYRKTRTRSLRGKKGGDGLAKQDD